MNPLEICNVANLLIRSICSLIVANVLDGICPDTPLLDFIGQANHWPRSATRKEWLTITRQLIQQTIAAATLKPGWQRARDPVSAATSGAVG